MQFPSGGAWDGQEGLGGANGAGSRSTQSGRAVQVPVGGARGLVGGLWAALSRRRRPRWAVQATVGGAKAGRAGLVPGAWSQSKVGGSGVW